MSGRLKSAGFIVGGLARRLPGRRAAAVRALLRDARSLVTGRGPEPTFPVGHPPIDPVDSWRARRAVAEGDEEKALRLVAGILAEHPDSLDALGIRRDIEQKRGDLTAALATIRVIRTIRDSADLARDERLTVGRLLETDPGWSLRVAGPPRPLSSPDPSVVMHLLAESLPLVRTALTLRDLQRLKAQQAGGLHPFVVTGLGFPRWAGVQEPAAIEEVEGIAHHRLDLGPRWPAEPPADILLTEWAWLAARVARELRPAIIHMGSGPRTHQTALVGMALREHLDVPLVCEVSARVVGTDDPGDLGRRRQATLQRCLYMADVVIAPDETSRDDLLELGFPPARVAIVNLPEGELGARTAAEVGARYRAIYDAVLRGKIPGHDRVAPSPPGRTQNGGRKTAIAKRPSTPSASARQH